MTAYSSRFGTLMEPDDTEPFFTTTDGVSYVCGFWGAWHIYAVLPMAEVTVTG